MRATKYIHSSSLLGLLLLLLTVTCAAASSEDVENSRSLCSQLPGDVDPVDQREIWASRISRNLEACQKLLASDPQEPDTYFYAGRLEFASTRPGEAERHFRAGANAGSAKAMTALGYFLAERQGNTSAMTELYKRAADKGDPVAQTQLGIMYWGGDAAWSSAVRRDLERAEELLRAAADQGDPVAHYALGMLLWPSEQDESREETLNEALRHLRAAASAGLPDARQTLQKKGFSVPEPPEHPNPLATLFDGDRVLMRP